MFVICFYGPWIIKIKFIQHELLLSRGLKTHVCVVGKSPKEAEFSSRQKWNYCIFLFSYIIICFIFLFIFFLDLLILGSKMINYSMNNLFHSSNKVNILTPSFHSFNFTPWYSETAISNPWPIFLSLLMMTRFGHQAWIG